MRLNTAVEISHPDRTPDGEGSLEDIQAPPEVIWCDPILNDSGMELMVNSDEDVDVGDIIRIPKL